MQQGGDMDNEELTHLDQLKELREFCVSKASVLFSTENNMATSRRGEGDDESVSSW
jgi:hypothetical protein